MRRLAAGLLVVLCLSLTACGGDKDAVGDMANAEANASDNLFDTTEASVEAGADTAGEAVGEVATEQPVETDAEGNPIIIEETQAVGKAQIKTEAKEERKVVPIKDTDLGEWTKTKEGFMFKSAETGEFIKASIMEVDGTVYFFNNEGILQDNVFVPTADGRTLYISNYEYVYGLVTDGNNIYYIDKDKGQLVDCKVKIGDELYCFDRQGKAIKESEWDNIYTAYTEEGLSEDTETETTGTGTETTGTGTETTGTGTETTGTETEQASSSEEAPVDNSEETETEQVKK